MNREFFLQSCYPNVTPLSQVKQQLYVTHHLFMNIQRISVEYGKYGQNKLWLFGQDSHGYSVAAQVFQFRPKFLMPLPKEWLTQAQHDHNQELKEDTFQDLIQEWMEEANSLLTQRSFYQNNQNQNDAAIYQMNLVKKVRLVGFTNREPDLLVEVVCQSMATWHKVIKHFKEYKQMDTLYHTEWNFVDQFKLYHDINYGQWVQLKNIKIPFVSNQNQNQNQHQSSLFTNLHVNVVSHDILPLQPTKCTEHAQIMTINPNLLKCFVQTKAVSSKAIRQEAQKNQNQNQNQNYEWMPQCDKNPHDVLVSIGLQFSWMNPPQQHITMIFTTLPDLKMIYTDEKEDQKQEIIIYCTSELDMLEKSFQQLQIMDPDVMMYFCEPLYDSLMVWFQRSEVWSHFFTVDRFAHKHCNVSLKGDHTMCYMLGRDFINLRHMVDKKCQLTYDDLYHISSDKDIKQRKIPEQYDLLMKDANLVNQSMWNGQYHHIIQMTRQDLRLMRLLEKDQGLLLELMGIASTNSIDVTTVAEWAMTKFAYGILTRYAQRPENNIYFNVEQLHSKPVRFPIETHPPTYPDPGEHPKNVAWRNKCYDKLKRIKAQMKKKIIQPEPDDRMWTDANLTQFTREFKSKQDIMNMKNENEDENEDEDKHKDHDQNAEYTREDEEEIDMDDDEDDMKFLNKELRSKCSLDIHDVFQNDQKMKLEEEHIGQANNAQTSSTEKEKQGGNVIADASGFYQDDALIEVLDFTSMYPRAQIAQNICYQNLFFEENLNELKRLMSLTSETRTIHDPQLIWIQVSKNATIPVAQKIVDFKIPGSPTNEIKKISALLPQIQWDLVLQRKAIKKKMEAAYEAGQKFEGDVFNSQQLAKKLAGNSLYGYCGAPITYNELRKPSATCLTLKELMLCTTSMGRWAQRMVAYHLTEKYQCIVLGGDTDSVFPWCPLYRERLPDFPLVCELNREHYQMDEFWAKEWKEFWTQQHKSNPSDITLAAKDEPADFCWAQVIRYWEQKIRTKPKTGDPSFVLSSLPLDNQLYAIGFLVGKKLAQEITGMMTWPSAIEFENALRNLWALGKKYYMGEIWDPEDIRFPNPKLKIKGMAAVKRNFCSYVRDTLKQIPRFLQNHQEHMMHAYIKERIMKLAQGQVSLDQIAISGATSEETRYKSNEIILLKLKQGIEQHHGITLKPGARVNYTILAGKGKKCNRVDLISNVEKYHLKVDWADYIKSQFYRPLQKLITFHRTYVDIDTILKEALCVCTSRMNGQIPLDEIFDYMED